MSRRGLILVEGQTEERFVKDVLAPAFHEKGLFLSPTILTTKRVKSGPNFKGGVTSFGRFEQDFRTLLVQRGDALLTTLIDYYGLPDDFPGMASRPTGSALTRVRHVESELLKHFSSPRNVVPFFALHEFETWLFVQPDVLGQIMSSSQGVPALAAASAQVATPEEINENPETAPSRRICAAFPAYRKALHGPLAVARTGLQQIRSKCPHFDWWMGELERFAPPSEE